ncbi:enhanced serine sensitivity protein SseB [Amphibacillus cookii]|uniref:enhanced serine sensitivity protein SseB n=1 Tax=Amphibacillus cookii TaxID=767787 RepID=UPI00195D1162|nr:enhanced serine sensitivity protein SseB [Amphibacillus cookii]MBM7543283.1 hypothetical protein [Amphibacillus cookii]
MNINKPLKNEKLNSIIEQLKSTNTVESETNFFKYLKKSTLLIPIIKDSSDENINISILDLQQTNGDKYIPLFTEWVDLKNFPSFEHVDGWLVKWKDYQKLLFDNPLWNGVVINPNSYNIVLNREQMGVIESDVLKKGEKIYTGIPKETPTDLIKNLIKVFKRHKYIKKAYILQMVRGNNLPNLLLIIESDVGINVFFEDINTVVKKYLAKDMLLDIMPLEDSFSKQAIQDVSPFYTVK